MKKNYDQILKEYEPKKISRFNGFMSRLLTRLFIMNKDYHFNYDFDPRTMKNKQVCLIADHASRNSFYFVINGYKYANFNIMVGWQNLFDKTMFKLLLKIGVIPKLLYSKDYKAVKSTLRLASEGASILMFPEGIQSTIGTTHPTNPSTFKLLKKLDMDIVLCTSHGAYLANPRFSNKFKKGYMEFNYSILFKKEELRELTIEEIKERYNKVFHYNDFTWNKEKQYSYYDRLGNAHGYEQLFYMCPLCKAESSIIQMDNRLICKECNLEIEIDDKYNLKSNRKIPFETLDKWFDIQRDSVLEEIKNDNFMLEFDVTYDVIDFNKLHKADDRCITIGEGKLIIDKNNIRYIGTINNENKEIIYDYSLTPSMILNPNKGLKIYSGSNYNEFTFKGDKSLAVKAMLASEAIHNLNDEAWKESFDTVYNRLISK